VSHVLAARPENILVSAASAAQSCDDEPSDSEHFGPGRPGRSHPSPNCLATGGGRPAG
jgi:hypothetical protein